MTTFDFFLLAPIAYGAFSGFRQGLLLEIVSLVAWVIAVVFGLQFLNAAIPVMRGVVGEAFGFLPFITFLVVFMLIIAAVRLVGTVAKKVIHLTPLGMLDSLGGGLLGALTWCLGVSLFLYVLNLTGISFTHEVLKKSEVYPVIAKATPYALQVVGFFLPFAKYLLSTLRGIF
ncbi:CvpA family protein [Adhaeribacter swui]|uniref:CvpA family protein n=1 Tax=Adhaeribacter swui TaxID=2086471 RepID=A0A7G7G7X4_9BACT|nr:CvpA family protein [Adhaeribacter swui]QNF33258.1 CvpA family protein [Adhaeribacter swui]